MNKHFLFLLQLIVVLVFASLMVFEAHALCVSSTFANLRESPSTNAGKTWKVVKFMPLQKVQASKGWFKVRDVDGDIHWVSQQLVSDKIKCATVKAERANLRTGPNGAKHPSFSVAEKYVTFRYFGSKDGWSKVQDDQGTIYWVSRNLIWVQ